jgi:diguanylate cyclase (GGDEF)-like protein
LPLLLFIPRIFVILGALLAPMHSAWAADKTILQLKWVHAYQFAGYYAAQDLGYYKAAALDVEIRSLQPGQDVLQEVISGNAQFGSGTSSLLIARQDGAPVVVLAAIYQHSPYVLIARQFKPEQSIHDLAGRPILLRRLSDELLVYLRREKIPESGIQRSVPGMNTVEELRRGAVDAISGYISNEPYQLKKAGFAYQLYSPRSVGIDLYGDNLFTSEEMLKKSPERVARFREASIKGWEYVLKHPQEAIALVQKYAPDASVEKIQFEMNQINPLIRADLVSVGYMNEGRWKHAVEIYREAGALNANFDLKGFVYNPKPKDDHRFLYGALALALIALIIIGAVAFYITRLNRRLSTSLNQVTHLARHDTLTGLPNRALFSDRLDQAILRATRDQTRFALLFIDLDRFKNINDQHGHLVGDEALKACCHRMLGSVRSSDSVGRIGGDEFVILLDNVSDIAGVLEIAHKIKEAVALPINTHGIKVALSVSIGIALFPDDAQDDETLLKRADLAMYQAKEMGRNSICLYSEAITK